MEEIYKNEKTILKLTRNEIISLLCGKIINGYKIKQIGMINDE